MLIRYPLDLEMPDPDGGPFPISHPRAGTYEQVEESDGQVWRLRGTWAEGEDGKPVRVNVREVVTEPYDEVDEDDYMAAKTMVRHADGQLVNYDPEHGDISDDAEVLDTAEMDKANRKAGLDEAIRQLTELRDAL